MGEIEKYKNAEEFAAAHGEEVEVEDSTIGQMIKEMFIRDIEMAKWKFDYEVDPLGVWWRVPSEKERFQTEMYQKWARADENRPEITSLTFAPVPKEKANGLKPKFGLFGGDWKKFVEELEAGRVEMAEVLLLSVEDVTGANDTINSRYYAKVADLNGNVLKGCVCVINHARQGFYIPDLGGWYDPYWYEEKYLDRSDEEFEAYEAAYFANAGADPVDPSERKHSYILRYNINGNQYYGLIFPDEYDDIKKIKDNVTYVSPSNIFSYNNMKPDFGW